MLHGKHAVCMWCINCFLNACRIDNDAVLMRDVYPVTALVGYQFSMRWTNAHVMYLRARSPLARRILRAVTSLPLDHPRFREDLVDKVGGPPPSGIHGELSICSSRGTCQSPCAAWAAGLVLGTPNCSRLSFSALHGCLVRCEG